jgi:hypothetical protein
LDAVAVMTMAAMIIISISSAAIASALTKQAARGLFDVVVSVSVWRSPQEQQTNLLRHKSSVKPTNSYVLLSLGDLKPKILFGTDFLGSVSGICGNTYKSLSSSILSEGVWEDIDL